MADRILDKVNKIVKESSTSAPGYLKNVGKSAYYGYGKVIEKRMPNMAKVADVNQEAMRSVVDILRNPTKLGSSLSNMVDHAAIMNQAKIIMSNAADDLKTGKFYDPNRDRSEEGMKTAALLDNFGGFDMDGFDDDGEYKEPTSSDADAITGAISTATEIQEDNADTRFKLSVQSDIRNTEAIIENQQIIAKSEMKMRLKEHANTMGMMGNTITLQASLLDFHNNQTVEHYRIVRETSSIMSEHMPQQTTLLREIKELLQRQADGSQGGSGSGSGGRRSQMSTTANEDAPFRNGVFDFAKYGKKVIKQTDREFGLSNAAAMIFFGMKPDEFMELFKSNPLEEIWVHALDSMIPNMTKNMATTLDKTLSSFLPALLLKMNKDAGGTDGNALMGKLLGTNVVSRKNFDTKYDFNGGASFDAVAHKTLVEIIPHRLGQIVSLLSGEPETIFDHTTGMYKNRATAAIEMKNRLEDITGDLYKTMDKFTEMMSQYKFETERDKEIIEKDMKTFLNAQARRQELYNPHKDKYNNLGISLDGGEKSYEFIRGMFKALNRSDLMNFNKETFEALLSGDERTTRANEEAHASGLINLFSEGSKRETDLIKSAKPFMTSTEMKDLYKRYGLKDDGSEFTVSVPRILSDIHDTLKMGIIVYPTKPGKENLNIHGQVSKNSRDTFRKTVLEPRELADRERERINQQDAKTREEVTEDPTKFIFSMTGERMSSDYLAEQNRNAMRKIAADRMAAEIREMENNPIGKFLSSFKFGKAIMDARHKVKEVTNDPFVAITKAMESVDKKIYSIIYGSDDSEDPANAHFNKGGESSFIGKMFKMMKFNFLSFRDFLAKDILDPLYDKLLGEDGIFTKIGKHMDPVKQKALQFGIDKTQELANYLLGDLVDDPDLDKATSRTLADGTVVTTMAKMRTGGVLSGVANQFKGVTNNIKKEASAQMSNLWGEMKTVMFGKGDTLDYSTGSERVVSDKGLLGGMIDMISGTKDSMVNFLLGGNKGMKMEGGKQVPTESKKIYDAVKSEFKGFFPKGVAGAGVGVAAYLGGGLLTGLFLPNGPLFAAILGSTASFIGHSDKLREYLFGATDDDGNFKSGVFDKELVDGVKKFAPAIFSGAAIGAMIKNFGLFGTTILPGGPIVGAFLGSIAGMTMASTQLKKVLFGEGVDEEGHFTEDYKKKMTEKIATAIPIGLGGFAVGSLISNFGILGAIPGMQFLALGTTLAALVNADDIKAYFLGKTDDKTGEHRDGVLEKMVKFGNENIFKPFVDGINNAGKNIQNWFKEAIVDPLAKGIEPIKEEFERSTKYIKEAFSSFGGWMKDGMNSVFEKSFGAPLEKLVQKYVTEPIKNLFTQIFSFIGKAIGGIVSAPFRAVGNMGERLDKKHKKEDAKLAFLNGIASIFTRKKDGKSVVEKFSDATEGIDNLVTSASIGLWSGMIKLQGLMGKGKEKIKQFGKDGVENAKFLAQVASEDAKALKSGISQRFANTWNKVTGIGSDTQGMTYDELKQYWSDDWASRKAMIFASKEDRAKMKAERSKSAEERRNAKKAKQEEKQKQKEAEELARQNANESEMRNRDLMLKKSNNPVTILKGILAYTKSIFHELKGNMDGLGWNMTYIRNILIDKFGAPSLLPDLKAFKGGRPKSLIRRVAEKIASPFVWAKNKVGDGLEWAGEKVHDLFVKILNPFMLIGKALEGVVEGIKTAGKAIGGVASFLWDAAGMVVPAILQLGVSVIDATLKTISLGAQVLMESIGLVFDFAGGLLKSFGEAIGHVATGLFKAGGYVIELLGDFSLLLMDLTRAILPELVKGFMDLLGFIGKTAIQLPLAISKGIYEFFTGKINIGLLGMRLEGGWLDSVKIIERFGDDRTTLPLTLLNMVHLGKGMLKARPKFALPVWIAGSSDANDSVGHSNTLLSQIKHILLSGTHVSEDGRVLPNAALNSDSFKDSINAASSVGNDPFAQVRARYKVITEKFKSSSDKHKAIHDMVTGVDDTLSDKAVKSTLDSVGTEAALTTNSLLGQLIHGTGKKDGLLGLGALLASLFSGPLGWLLSTMKSILSGNWWQIVENSFRRGFISKFLDPLLKKFYKEHLAKMVEPFMENIGKATRELSEKYMKPIFETMNTHLARIATHTSNLWTLFSGSVKEGAEKVSKKVSRYTTGGIIKRAGAYYADSTIGKNISRGVNRVLYGKMTEDWLNASYKMVGETMVEVPDMVRTGGVLGMAKNAMQQGGLAGKVGSFIVKVLDSKEFQAAAGKNSSKLIGKVKSIIPAITKKLATVQMSETAAAKIAKRVVGGPINIIFCVYDFTSGMAEAATIFKISKSTNITWKMRFIAGLAKMITGAILFGLIPDSWVAGLLMSALGSEDEKLFVEGGNQALEAEWNQYKLQTGKDISFDDFNSKVANKRVFTKFTDGIKWAWNGISTPIKNVGAFFGNTIISGFKYIAGLVSAPFKDLYNLFADIQVFWKDGFFAGMGKMFENIGKLIYDTIFTYVIPIKPIVDFIKFVGSKMGMTDADVSPGMNLDAKPKLSSATSIDAIRSAFQVKPNQNVLMYGKGDGMSPENVDAMHAVKNQVNGLYHFNQKDSRWGSKAFGMNDTIAKSGCAPTVAADLISNYDQRKIVTPDILASMALKGNYKTKNGTNPNFFTDIGKKYGIRVHPGIKNSDAIKTQLRANKPVIVMGKRMGKNSPYSTRNMHYMLAVNYDDSTQQVALLDPLTDDIKYASIVDLLADTVSVMNTSSITSAGMKAKFIGANKAPMQGPVLTGSTGPIAKTTKDFIQKILNGAVSGFKKYGVLPSLTMAQAILESASGKHSIGNNIFGIKAGKAWSGLKRLVNTSEFVNGVKQRTQAFFRDYSSIDESIEDHAKLLSGNRYRGVISSRNYRDAAHAVKAAGYATDPAYANKLINIIEKYGLSQYDQWGSGSLNESKVYGSQVAAQYSADKAKMPWLPSSVDGIPYFYQKDARWANNPYDIAGGKETIGTKGCAPVTLAMVGKAYGVDTYPSQIAQYAKDIKAVTKTGTTTDLFYKWGKKHGIDFHSVTKASGKATAESIKKNLSMKKPMILMGKKASALSPYRSSGNAHYVIASSYDDKKKMVRIIDGEVPGSTWVPLSSMMADTSIFTFTGKGGKGYMASKYQTATASTQAAKKLAPGEVPLNPDGSVPGFGVETTGLENVSNVTGMSGFDGIMDSVGIMMGAAANYRYASQNGSFWDHISSKLMGSRGNGDYSMTGSAFSDAENKISSADLKAATEANPIMPLGKYSPAFKQSEAGGWLSGDTDIHRFFGERLMNFAKDGLQKPVRISDGSRNRTQQWNIYRKNPAKAAKPWRMSNHYTGLAVDAAGMESVPESLLNKFRLWRPHLDGKFTGGIKEPWHIEPIETKKGDARYMENMYGSVIDWGKGTAVLADKVKASRNWRFRDTNSNSFDSFYSSSMEPVIGATNIVAQNIKAKSDLAAQSVAQSIDKFRAGAAQALSSGDMGAIVNVMLEQTKVLCEIKDTLVDIRSDMQEDKEIKEETLKEFRKERKNLVKNPTNPTRNGMRLDGGNGEDIINSIIKK